MDFEEENKLKKEYVIYKEGLNPLIRPKSLCIYKPGIEQYDFNTYIKDKEAWFSAFSEFNDPFEGKAANISKDSLIEYLKNEGRRNKLDNEQIINSLNNKEAYIDGFMDYFLAWNNKLNSQWYVSCLSENPYNILMWSYYSNKHRGFCIEYNFEDLFNMFYEIMFPVIYQERYADYFENIDRYADSPFILFCTKGDFWKHEKEWRIILRKDALTDVKNNGGKHRMPKPKAIYLGCNVDKDGELYSEISKYNAINNIVYKMELDEERFRLKKKKI